MLPQLQTKEAILLIFTIRSLGASTTASSIIATNPQTLPNNPRSSVSIIPQTKPLQRARQSPSTVHKSRPRAPPLLRHYDQQRDSRPTPDWNTPLEQLTRNTIFQVSIPLTRTLLPHSTTPRLPPLFKPNPQPEIRSCRNPPPHEVHSRIPVRSPDYQPRELRCMLFVRSIAGLTLLDDARWTGGQSILFQRCGQRCVV